MTSRPDAAAPSPHETWSRRHPILKWTGIGFATLLALVVLALSLLDWNLLIPPIERIASEKSGRKVTLSKPLSVHIWSWTPSIALHGLTVGNPSWESGPPMLQMQQLDLSVQLLPLLKGTVILPSVALIRPTVYLHQEKSGRANWTFENQAPTNAKASGPTRLPVVRNLLIEGGRLQVIDDIRHLKIEGSIDAHEKASHDDPKAFRIQAQGSLNDKPFLLAVAGGPLVNLDPDHPYPFDIKMTAGDIQVQSTGRVTKPFDLGQLAFDVTFSGNDLADLYYLTQLALPNTRPFKLHAHVERNGMRVKVTDILGTVGSSDLRGTLDVDATRKRPDISGDLVSNRLALRDLAASLGGDAKPGGLANGAHNPGEKVSPPSARDTQAKGEKSAPAKPDERLFPDAHLQVDRVRAMDADVRFSAKDIEAGSFPLKQVALHIKLDEGVLSLDPFAFEMPQGRLSGTARIDATARTPAVRIDVRMKDIQLGQLKGSAPDAKPPLDGIMQARVAVNGKGDSLHRVMSNANGNFALILPHGQVNAAFAELTGINVSRGIGLLLKGNDDRAQIRCGIADFNIREGDMYVEKMVFDTQDVLITGSGDIDLGRETLDLSIKGQPKHIRFTRLRTPIFVRGHLLKPSFGVSVGDTLAQGAAAVALGVVLTPAAALLAFVDPGLAQNQDCAALLQPERGKATKPAQSNDSPGGSAPATHSPPKSSGNATPR